jgi:L-alanine-DL-glutamate epimerase-like enolase superfamily enzyme
MKITDVRVRYYEYTLGRPVGDVNFPTGNDKASAAFTFVDTDEGITGVALSGSAQVKSLGRVLIGEDPRGVVGLWKKLNDQVFKRGVEGDTARAVAALDWRSGTSRPRSTASRSGDCSARARAAARATPPASTSA